MHKKRLIIIGASGHGKVILDVALKYGYEVTGFLDDDTSKEEFAGYSVLGTIDTYEKYKKDHGFVIAIGDNQVREQIVNQMLGVTFETLIHPSAVIGMDVSIGDGTVVMANAVINPGTMIGVHCIINTAAVVEHDNVIEDYVHISPGAVLVGTITVRRRTHVGVGATIRNNINITSDVVIGAGAVVVKDIKTSGTYIGIPAKERE